MRFVRIEDCEEDDEDDGISVAWKRVTQAWGLVVGGGILLALLALFVGLSLGETMAGFAGVMSLVPIFGILAIGGIILSFLGLVSALKSLRTCRSVASVVGGIFNASLLFFVGVFPFAYLLFKFLENGE